MPIRDDKRYRSWRRSISREANAVIIYMMDVSGSMTDEQKEIVRTEAFWIDTWLRSQYDGVETSLHHSRRGGQGSRRAHLLPHARKRRHADQLGLQGLRGPDRQAVSARRMEHLLLPVLRRRQLGRRQRAEPATAARDAAAAREPVLLRPGRKPLRQRRVHPRARAGIRRRARERWCSPRSRTKKGFTTRSRRFLGKGSK